MQRGAPTRSDLLDLGDQRPLRAHLCGRHDHLSAVVICHDRDDVIGLKQLNRGDRCLTSMLNTRPAHRARAVNDKGEVKRGALLLLSGLEPFERHLKVNGLFLISAEEWLAHLSVEGCGALLSVCSDL